MSQWIRQFIVYLFLSHPRESNMSYTSHLLRAWSLSFELLKGSSALFIHGLIPALFRETGSRTVARLHKVLFPES